MNTTLTELFQELAVKMCREAYDTKGLRITVCEKEFSRLADEMGFELNSEITPGQDMSTPISVGLDTIQIATPRNYITIVRGAK